MLLLSPAYCGGKRAKLVMSERAQFDLARRLRAPAGASIGEVFSFLSGLYFRGKMAYASAFARPPARFPGAVVITPNRGLLPADKAIGLADLRAFAEVDVDENDPRYFQPLRRDCEELLDRAPDAEVVLLGSIATQKYSKILLDVFGERLLYPVEFVGRGDMSRGGLMLRCVAQGRELEYRPLAGAVRRGMRPAKLAKLPPAAPSKRIA